ncbi:ADP-ribosyltransferase [Salmonella phage 40]|nr:ADP-ribosyltransferase [Salmonella phage 40]
MAECQKATNEDNLVNSISINGNIINGNVVGGDMNITSRGDNIYINGELVHTTQEKNITVVIHGNTKDISTVAGDVNVYGTVAGNIKTTSGDVHVEHRALGEVTTVSGDVYAEKIEAM